MTDTAISTSSAFQQRSSQPQWSSELERLQSFGRAIDAIHAKIKAQLGAEDLRYIRRVHAISRGAEAVGRTLIALSPGPLMFSAGVLSLWVYKQLQATEIGHGALHGAYNKLVDEDDPLHGKSHIWQTPIDEESWRRGHNGRHHGLTNVAGEDADIHFGPVRLTPETPHRFGHYFQLPFTLLILLPGFVPLMNLHFTGVTDVWSGNGRDEFDFIEDRSPRSVRAAYRRALRKYIPYYAKEYLMWPLVTAVVLGLSPLIFAKVLLGNFLAEKLRNLYSGVTIICGHVGEQTASYAEGTRPRCKGERHAMQVEATNNFKVPWLVSVFCGALDKQIEHHLFPALPPNRLREIAPEVQAACEAHEVDYRQESWPRTLAEALRQITRLSRPQTNTDTAQASTAPSLG